MKLTKNILSEHGMHNPYNIATKTGTKIFIDYIPADNGRLTSHYAYWQFTRITETGYAHLEFTVKCREEKQNALNKAIVYVKGRYGIDITDKDPFGAYHPAGTLEKLKALVKG